MELIGLLLFTVVVFGWSAISRCATRAGARARQLESRTQPAASRWAKKSRDRLKQERGLGSGLGWFYDLGSDA